MCTLSLQHRDASSGRKPGRCKFCRSRAKYIPGQRSFDASRLFGGGGDRNGGAASNSGGISGGGGPFGRRRERGEPRRAASEDRRSDGMTTEGELTCELFFKLRMYLYCTRKYVMKVKKFSFFATGCGYSFFPSPFLFPLSVRRVRPDLLPNTCLTIQTHSTYLAVPFPFGLLLSPRNRELVDYPRPGRSLDRKQYERVIGLSAAGPITTHQDQISSSICPYRDRVRCLIGVW